MPSLTPDTIDDLIYSARVNDLAALKEDLATLAGTHSTTESAIVFSAIDNEPESEGGTGGCLLHYPAANGNLEILEYLLHLILKNGDDKDQKKNLINHKNHSGNTPLHWAALNTHLGCVKALVEAGADVSLKNDAGLDAVFLAERSAWDADADGEEGEEKGGDGQGEGDGEGDKGKMSPGREVVEWLLSCEEGKGGEEGEKEGGGEGNEK